MSTHPTNPSASGPHLKLAALFGIAGALATLALMPYLLALVPTQLAALHWPQPALVLTQVGATGVLCWLLGWAGLRLGAPYGLDAPWLRAWVYRQPHDPARRSRWSFSFSGSRCPSRRAGCSRKGIMRKPKRSCSR